MQSDIEKNKAKIISSGSTLDTSYVDNIKKTTKNLDKE